MEKDSDTNSAHSSTNDTEDENEEIQDLEIVQFDVHLIAARQLQLYGKMRQLRKEMEDRQITLRHLTSQLQENKDLSKDTFENLPLPPFPETLHRRPEIIHDPCKTVHVSVIKGLNYTSPQKTSDDEAKVDIIDTKSNSPEVSTWSEESYEGKGKEAENPKFRYKKRSKPETSSIEAPSQETPVKLSKEPSGTPETKTPEFKSPKAVIARISPAVKRKESELDESCVAGTSKISGNRADDEDYLKIAKKLKFDDDESPSKQCPLLTSLMQDYYIPVSSEYIQQSLMDQSRKESEQFALPSTSGILRVVRYASSSEESAHFSGSDDVTCSEKEQSSPTSGNDDVTCSDREDSSLTSGSECTLQSEGKESWDLSELFGNSSDGESHSNTKQS